MNNKRLNLAVIDQVWQTLAETYPDCSQSYLLATPSVVEQIPHLTTLLVACSTLAPASCTLRSSLAAAPYSHSQYLALCNSGGYHHPNS
jgi:hypothetical protein